VAPSQIEQRISNAASQVRGAQFSTEQAIDFGSGLRSREAVPADQRGAISVANRLTQ